MHRLYLPCLHLRYVGIQRTAIVRVQAGQVGPLAIDTFNDVDLTALWPRLLCRCPERGPCSTTCWYFGRLENIKAIAVQMIGMNTIAASTHVGEIAVQRHWIACING